MLLWHYTKLDVLFSILNNLELPTLRACNVLHLNDSSELRHGLKIISNTIAANGKSDENDEILSSLKLMQKPEFDPCLFSFSLSAAKDSLDQWRAYSPAKEGISLGFDLKEGFLKDGLMWTPLFAEDWKGQVQEPRFRDCTYLCDSELLPEELFTHYPHKLTEPNLLTNAMFIKHPAFESEREHRLFFHPMPDNRFGIPIQTQKGRTFIDFYFDISLLRYVMVSPQGNKEESRERIEAFFQHQRVTSIDVLDSEIPWQD